MAAAQWAPDPTERHELRYYDGLQWTDHVSDQGVQSTDPLATSPVAPVVPMPAGALSTPPSPAPGTPPPPVYGATGPLMPGSHLPVPAGTVVSSRWKRFGGAVLSLVLLIVTLFIGYAIWALIVWDRGQTPAKQLLGMRVIKTTTGRKASYGEMFLRGFVIDGVLGNVSAGIFNLISALWIFGDDRQRLTDKMVSTIVVDDPQDLYR